MARHKLTDKNLEAMTAVCSVDGPVRLHRSGRDVRCAVASQSGHQRWARLNPDKAQAAKAKKSAHKLTSRDETTATGECPVCGTVGIVPKGRGFMCRNRAEELWTTQQATPQKRCGRCVKFFLNADGTCRYCDDELALDLGKAIKAGEDLGNLRAASAQRTELTTTTDVSRPQGAVLANDSRVDGWRVIGGGIPEGADPNRFVNDWLAQYEHLLEDA